MQPDRHTDRNPVLVQSWQNFPRQRAWRAIVEEPAVVADAVLLGPDGNGHPEDERPQEGPVNAVAVSERVSLNNLLLRVEEIQVEVGRLTNDICKLCLDQES